MAPVVLIVSAIFVAVAVATAAAAQVAAAGTVAAARTETPTLLSLLLADWAAADAASSSSHSPLVVDATRPAAAVPITNLRDSKGKTDGRWQCE